MASVRIASAALLLLHVYLDPRESRGLTGEQGLATVAAGWGHQPAAAQIVLTAMGCCRAPLTHPFPTAPPPAAFYSGSLLKGLAGSCALTLLIAPLRNRLRFRWVGPASWARRMEGPCLACLKQSCSSTARYTSPGFSCHPCSNHLLVQLAKLNLCGLTNSFMCKQGGAGRQRAPEMR